MDYILDKLNIFEGTIFGKCWNYLFVELADARTNDWPLLRNPLPLILIVCGYWYFSTKLGPKIMENRKPFKLREVLLVYNLLQVLFSAFLIYEVSQIIIIIFAV